MVDGALHLGPLAESRRWPVALLGLTYLHGLCWRRLIELKPQRNQLPMWESRRAHGQQYRLAAMHLPRFSWTVTQRKMRRLQTGA